VRNDWSEEYTQGYLRALRELEAELQIRSETARGRDEQATFLFAKGLTKASQRRMLRTITEQRES
jgi:hypothetical protein